MQRKPAVLFVCVHSSARSQMAAAWMNHLCGDLFTAESAGLEPGSLNPLAVEAMADAGIDISRNGTRSVFEAFRSGVLYAYVIRVCNQTEGERCPIFPGSTTRLDWSFPDPAKVTGAPAEKLAKVCAIRDAIRAKIEAWCEEVCGEQMSEPETSWSAR
jgi:arsenate reductase (thioredoxin)